MLPMLAAVCLLRQKKGREAPQGSNHSAHLPSFAPHSAKASVLCTIIRSGLEYLQAEQAAVGSFYSTSWYIGASQPQAESSACTSRHLPSKPRKIQEGKQKSIKNNTLIFIFPPFCNTRSLFTYNVLSLGLQLGPRCKCFAFAILRFSLQIDELVMLSSFLCLLKCPRLFTTPGCIFKHSSDQ